MAERQAASTCPGEKASGEHLFLHYCRKHRRILSKKCVSIGIVFGHSEFNYDTQPNDARSRGKVNDLMYRRLSHLDEALA